MTEPPQQQQSAPPVGEEIHMPAPSVIPLLNAAGLALAIVGITTGKALVAAGLILFLVTTVRWIADTRRDISHLPAEHH